jgi:hypothetical protein
MTCGDCGAWCGRCSLPREHSTYVFNNKICSSEACGRFYPKIKQEQT